MRHRTQAGPAAAALLHFAAVAAIPMACGASPAAADELHGKDAIVGSVRKRYVAEPPIARDCGWLLTSDAVLSNLSDQLKRLGGQATQRAGAFGK